MGDKSPKSKERGNKQKNVAKQGAANAAKNKQAGYSSGASMGKAKK